MFSYKRLSKKENPAIESLYEEIKNADAFFNQGREDKTAYLKAIKSYKMILDKNATIKLNKPTLQVEKIHCEFFLEISKLFIGAITTDGLSAKLRPLQEDLTQLLRKNPTLKSGFLVHSDNLKYLNQYVLGEYDRQEKNIRSAKLRHAKFVLSYIDSTEAIARQLLGLSALNTKEDVIQRTIAALQTLEDEVNALPEKDYEEKDKFLSKIANVKTQLLAKLPVVASNKRSLPESAEANPRPVKSIYQMRKECALLFSAQNEPPVKTPQEFTAELMKMVEDLSQGKNDTDKDILYGELFSALADFHLKHMDPHKSLWRQQYLTLLLRERALACNQSKSTKDALLQFKQLETVKRTLTAAKIEFDSSARLTHFLAQSNKNASLHFSHGITRYLEEFDKIWKNDTKEQLAKVIDSIKQVQIFNPLQRAVI